MRFSTPDEWLRHLEAIHPSEIDMGLERVSRVADRLNCKKPAPIVILVGGTNGKGTTSALIAALLRAQGKRVGMYNSPHIHKYNERVSVDGSDISDSDLCASFDAVEQGRGDVTLTYFEFGTLSALWHFNRQKLDAVVLEIGLGGRLDAVNIAEPDISVVTSIGLDHQDWLGDTVEQIAYEKCNIARKDKWLVFGQENAPETVAQTVSEIGAQLAARGDMFSAEIRRDGLTVHYMAAGQSRRLTFAKYGIPHHNVATAVQTLALIDQLPDDDVITAVVADLKVAGRWQSWQCDGTTLILDVAHNPQAASYLRYHTRDLDCLVLGMFKDKDVAGVLNALPPFKKLYTVTLSGWRGQTSDELAEKCESAGFTVNQSFETMSDALGHIPDQGISLAAGSFQTVEAAGDWIASRGSQWNSI